MSGSGISVDKQAGGIAVVTLAREPVNTMGMAFWKELRAVVDDLEADAGVRAMIFRSGLKKNVFTAGLDIQELYAPNSSEAKFREYWAALTTTLVKIYATPKMTAAAVKGACPAGGCCLSLCCDYRVITADGTMGLNEVRGGIPPPVFWVELFAKIVGQQRAELLLMRGDMTPSAKLLEYGLVHAVVENEGELLPATTKEVQRLLMSPDAGRAMTKNMLRQELAKRWSEGCAWEAGIGWKTISDPRSVAAMTKVLKMLAEGRAKMSKL